MWAAMRKMPPRVETMAAGGMWRVVSPDSLTWRLGQQLSTQVVGAEVSSVLATFSVLHESQVKGASSGAAEFSVSAGVGLVIWVCRVAGFSELNAGRDAPAMTKRMPMAAQVMIHFLRCWR